MNIHKLKFSNHEEARTIFIDKGVINNDLKYINGTQAVVKLPPQIQVEGVYNGEFEVITEPVFYPEVFYDVMTSDTIDFGVAIVAPMNPTHSFYRTEPNV